MKIEPVIKRVFTKSALVGAALAIICGLLLWGTTLGDWWENTSYDLLFRFGSLSVTNRITLVLMDNDSYEHLNQDRAKHWDRALHTQLLRKLTEDGARLVVFDVLFKNTNNPEMDAELADAMRQNGNVVLAADDNGGTHPKIESASIVQPQELFLNAAAGWGVGHVDSETGAIVRRHWPFSGTNEGDFHSLSRVAAERLGARFDRAADQQWLRYYGESAAWEPVSYRFALSNAPGFFRDKIVFIGNWPSKPSDPGAKEPSNDKFRTPYTRWNGKAVGGVEIMATTFLNLVNGDWLRRAPAWIEAALLALTGILIGGGICHLKPLPSLLVAAGISTVVMLACVSLSYVTNYWLPWLMISGGQVPCALAWAWVSRTQSIAVFQERFPGYATVGASFAKGAYGKVWLVRNVTGQLQALKEIERARLQDRQSYEREFHGLRNYKPVSNEHLGLLHIDHLNRNEEQGYFYYVMELGDPLDSDWEKKGEPYKPRDLANVCLQKADGRLPVRECLRIGIVLLESLNFLHQRGLVHRDIKPSNIIFVNGRPKLADVGLVRGATEDSTWVGTPFFMPPLPEPPGTMLADIYAMGKVLYVLSTGKHPSSFAEISTTLVEKPEFMRLNEIICKACQPFIDQRYSSAVEMLVAMREAQRELDAGDTERM